MKPKVCVLKTDGINCDQEMVQAFLLAGGNPKVVHINQLRSKEEKFSNFQILAIPGGFSYGDDIASGKILALELISYLGDQVTDFLQKQRGLVLGVCNGFQVLVRAGLLPGTLEPNTSGHFECRWVNLKVERENRCEFLRRMSQDLSLQVAHGEGKFFAPPETLKKIEYEKLVVFRYAKPEYPANPNGSVNDIAGICDHTGRILGLMPHPERFVEKTQAPNWRRDKITKPQGRQVFEGMVRYFL